MSIYVDIAIAIILVFFSLSLVVTALNEVVATALNLRGRLLWRALTTLLDDDDLRARVLSSAPLRAVLLTRTGRDRPGAARFPEWLPSRDVARALLSAIPADTHSLPGPATLVGGLVAEAREATEETVTALAARYDAAMAQLSIRYKRSQQVWAAVFGIALATALNVDIVAMATAMSADEALRAAIVGHAEAFVAQAPPATVAAATPAPGATPDSAATPEQLQSTLAAFALELKDLDEIASLAGFGWTVDRIAAFGESWLGALSIIAAWTVAGLSTVLGAPFWFDLLSKSVRIRAAR